MQGQQPMGSCFAAQQCTNDYIHDYAATVDIEDPLQKTQALCESLTKRVKCMCGNCEATIESDPSFIQSHTDNCSPAMMATFHLAGGACTGFATGFCELEINANFCENFAVPPVLGSKTWMANHEIIDPGPEAATAGADLFSNQMPNYAQEIADSMSKYLTAGAAAQASQARLNNAVLNEMQQLSPEEGGAAGAGLIPGMGGGNTTKHWYCLYFC